MAEKGNPPPAMAPPPNVPADAPPSYQESEGAGAGGGFVAPPGVPPPATYPKLPANDPTQNNMQGQPQQQQPTVIVQYVNAPNFGPRPVNMTCPHCQAQIRTQTDSEPGPMAWILAGVLCIVGLWPCACIPCCIDSLNSVTHKCPQCKNFLGRYKGGM